MDTRLVLSFLEEQSLINPDQSREIAEEQNRSAKPVETIVANFGILQVPQLLEKISDSLGLPMIPDLQGVEFSRLNSTPWRSGIIGRPRLSEIFSSNWGT